MSEVGCKYIMKQGSKKGYPCGFPCRGDFCFKHKNEQLTQNNQRYDIVEDSQQSESDSDSEEFVLKQNKIVRNTCSAVSIRNHSTKYKAVQFEGHLVNPVSHPSLHK